MPTLTKIFINICLFRAKPQDLPASQSLTILSGFVLAITNLFGGNIGLNEDISTGVFFMFSIGQVVTLGLLTWLILRTKNLSERWYQSITALFGTQVIINLIIIPLVSWHLRIAGSFFSGEVIVLSVPMFMIIMAALWAIAVATYILRYTLESTRLPAFFLTISLLLASNIIPSMLLPK